MRGQKTMGASRKGTYIFLGELAHSKDAEETCLAYREALASAASCRRWERVEDNVGVRGDESQTNRTRHPRRSQAYDESSGVRHRSLARRIRSTDVRLVDATSIEQKQAVTYRSIGRHYEQPPLVEQK